MERSAGYNKMKSHKHCFKCSECGWKNFNTSAGDTETYKYCPNCGAVMYIDRTAANIVKDGGMKNE